MPQKRRKQSPKKKPLPMESKHIVGLSGVGKNTDVASILKSNRESGQQFGVLDPHGDTLPSARKLFTQPPKKLKRPAKKRS